MHLTLYTGVPAGDAHTFLVGERVEHTVVQSLGWTERFGRELGSVITLVAAPSIKVPPERGLKAVIRRFLDHFKQQTALIIDGANKAAMIHTTVPEKYREAVAKWEAKTGEKYIREDDEGLFAESLDDPVCPDCGVPHGREEPVSKTSNMLALLSALAAAGRTPKNPLANFPDFADNPKSGGRREDN